jgi:hypothetical protein
MFLESALSNSRRAGLLTLYQLNWLAHEISHLLGLSVQPLNYRQAILIALKGCDFNLGLYEGKVHNPISKSVHLTANHDKQAGKERRSRI